MQVVTYLHRRFSSRNRSPAFERNARVAPEPSSQRASYHIFEPCAVTGSSAVSPACSLSGSPSVWPSQCSCIRARCTAVSSWRPPGHPAITWRCTEPASRTRTMVPTDNRTSAAASAIAMAEVHRSDLPHRLYRCPSSPLSATRCRTSTTRRRASSRQPFFFRSATDHPAAPLAHN